MLFRSKKDGLDALSVHFVIRRNQLIIFFICCKLARFVWRVVHFTFNISHPTNVTNMFGNWLNEVPKNPRRILKLVFVLCFGQFGIVVVMLFLTNLTMLILYRLCTDLLLDPHMLLPTTCRPAEFYGFQMYSAGDGRSGYV